uniref:Uncharacterized protein n=1 Tax=viral metagenome TaxID=1070528 RepID=A0A6M3JYU9_9ZZZZ
MMALLVGCAQFSLIPGPTADYVSWQPTQGEAVLVPPVFTPPSPETLEQYVPPGLGMVVGDGGEKLILKIFTNELAKCRVGSCDFQYSEAWVFDPPHDLYGMCGRVGDQWVCVRRDPQNANLFHLRIREK